MRLDVLVYRACLAKSFRSARQLISYGHVLVNECSFECKPGDVFRVSSALRQAGRFESWARCTAAYRH
ncbi:MAG: S4 domain-containing protein [Candidatus Hodgkinia cicadicola]